MYRRSWSVAMATAFRSMRNCPGGAVRRSESGLSTGCRQKLAEFGKSHAKVTLATTDGATLETTVGELLPGAFGAGHMDRV